MKIWGQIVSIAAMAAIILSFQCKSNKKLAFVYGTGASLFAISYFMLGQPSAALYNIISAIFSIMCLKNSLKTKLNFGIIMVLFALATYFTYENWWSLVLMSAVVTSAYSMMFRSGTFIRNTRFFYISPIWIINNSVFCFSIGGLICDITTMVSVLISFIRYRKTGFDN